MAVPLRQRGPAQAEDAGPRPRTAWHRLRQHKLAMAGLAFIIVLIIIAILAPVLAPADPNKQDLFARLAPPGTPFDELGEGRYWLGADQLGRDVLSRVMYGARISLLVGFVAEGIVLLIGVTLGALAGYYGGWVDIVLTRIADIVLSFPQIMLILVIVSMVGPSLRNIMLVLGLLGWPPIFRIVRGQFLSLREQDFVQAGRALGARDFRIISRHILPNSLGPILVAATFGTANAILTEASLSFLGMGVQPPTASWGNMLIQAQSSSVIENQPWLWVPPGLMIFISVLAINFVGDGLRDALDPRLKQ